MSSRDDPDSPPTEAELEAAASLRRALERASPGRTGDADAELAEAIRAAAAPKPLAEKRLRAIVDESLSKRTRGKVIYFAFGGAASLAAMAAAIAIVVKGPPNPEATSVALSATGTSMALSRSTASLFPDGIPKAGGTSDRVDRIAYARARDLRENQFVRWGVR
jgi:N-acyl-D-aspartate/D-glutamate deacylase